MTRRSAAALAGLTLALMLLGGAAPSLGITFTVNSTGDGADTNTADGVCDSDAAAPGLQCTLRAAIAQANAVGGADIIAFNIPPAGAKTITPGSKLPNVNETVTIDGTTQPGFVNAPIIEINGSIQGPFQALDIFAPSTIRGLVINRLVGGTGIVLWAGSGGSVVEGCYIGTDLLGTMDFGNSFNGIIVRSAGNRIGGTTVPQRNVISGNTSPGIALDTGASNTLIQGNFIGTNAAGTVALGNSDDNILVVNGASNNTIGGTDGVTLGGPCTGACNVVSGSLNFNGIAIFGSNVTGNVVIGNYIGTDVTGTQDLGNAGGGAFGGNGIYNQAPSTRIGGPTPQERNVISGNSASGIFLDAAITTGVRIEGNFIGTQVDGVTPLPNARGVLVEEAVNNFIGGTTAGAGNVIAGNMQHGVEIRNGATANRVEGNFIGTDAAGTAVIPNGGAGVLVNNSNDTTIGGTGAGAANRIARNGGNGVTVTGTSVRTSIRRNLIHDNGGLGVDLAGNGVTPNDPGDGDSGPNDLINFPEGITKTYEAATTQTLIRGRLDTANPETVQVELFGNVALDPSNNGEGQIYLDTVTPDANGFFCSTIPYQVTVDVTATATNAAGSTSEFSGKTEVELIALEVTQAVQDWTNSVTLVKDKTTYVRAHLQTVDSAGAPIGVTTQLRGFRNSIELPDSPLTAINFGGFQAKPNATTRRGTWTESLNFRLPATWLDGNVELRFERSDGGIVGCKEPGDASGPAGQCSDCRVQVSFQPTDSLKLGLVAINYTNAGTMFHFGASDLGEVIRIITALYPVASINWTSGQMAWAGTVPPVADDVLNAMEKNSISDFFSNRIYFGAIPGPPGLFAGTLGTALTPGEAASGYVPDTFFGLGRTTAPHEIGHSLDRAHALDVALFGTCPSNPNRSYGACNECGQNPPQGGVFPHFYAPTSPSPSANGTLHPTFGPLTDPDETALFGLNTSTRFPTVMDPNAHFELMSYCRVQPLERWISRFTYDGLRARINAIFFAGSVTATKGSVRGAQQYLIVRGTVNLRSGLVQFRPFYTIVTATSPPAPQPGSYSLQLRDGSGGILTQISFEPRRREADGEDPESASFSIPVLANPAIRQVVVLRNQTPVASRVASANPPTIQLTYPNGGESLTQDPVVLQWNGNDPEGDSLVYDIQYSTDGGANWRTLMVDATTTTYSMPREVLSGTSAGLFRVSVSDGFHTASDQSDAVFSVPGHAPSVSILFPTESELFAADQQIVFEASARDVEEGDLTGSSLQWTSSLDGALGSGRLLMKKASQLSQGTHTITATATDSSTATGSAFVQISVGQAPPASYADLSVDQGIEPELGVVGQQVTFTLAVRNEGRDVATGVTLADILPPGVTFQSANSSQGSCGEAGGTVPCSLGSLAAGASATVTIIVTPSAAGRITNTATVDAIETDPVPATNTSSRSLTVDPVPTANLAVTIYGFPEPVAAGGSLAYSISVSNYGPSVATGISISDMLPAGTSFVSATGAGWSCGHASGTVTCTRPSLGLFPAPSISVVVTAPSSAGTLANTVSVSAAEADVFPNNNSATAYTTVVTGGGAPSNFHTLAPCRVVDTRDAAGPYGAPPLSANSERVFTVTGQCGVPVNARAVAFNVTITGSTSPGHLTMYPGGTGIPLASMLNFSAGQTRANNAIIPLGTGGTVAATAGLNSGTVHLILDINGYFD